MRRIALVCLFSFLCCSSGASDKDRVTFRTADGFQLEGRKFGNGSPVVVFAHMEGSDQSAWFDLASALTEMGFSAFTFNFRGHGESEGEPEPSVVDRDVAAAVTFINETNVKKVVLVGAGMGGTGVLIAGKAPDVLGIVALSAPERVDGLDAHVLAIDVEASKLLIASQKDVAAVASAEALYRALGDPREIKIVAGGEHGTNMLGGEGAKELEDLIRNFIVKVTA